MSWDIYGIYKNIDELCLQSQLFCLHWVGYFIHTILLN